MRIPIAPGFGFVGNYIQNNEDVGRIYEISYNALIEYNAVNSGVPPLM